MSSAPRPFASPRPPLDARSRWVMILGIVLALLGAVALGATAWLQRPAQANDDAALRAVHGLSPTTSPDQILNAARAADPNLRQTASGLLYEETQPGTGPRVGREDVALLMYTGRLPDGSVFDQSQHVVSMPVADLVPGFSEALTLMNKGSHLRVWIKPSLGYGNHTAGSIPPNSVLIFDIQLVDFLTRDEVQQMQVAQAMQQMQATGQQSGNAGATGDH